MFCTTVGKILIYLCFLSSIAKWNYQNRERSALVNSKTTLYSDALNCSLRKPDKRELMFVPEIWNYMFLKRFILALNCLVNHLDLIKKNSFKTKFRAFKIVV